MRTTLTLAFLCTLSSSLFAQANSCLADLKMPPVGEWAEYRGIMNKKDSMAMRYAVVGEEEREGTAMKWLELRMIGSKPDKNMTWQVLTSGSPAELDAAQEVIVKHGTQPAMKMNPMMLGIIRGQLGKNSLLGDLCEGVSPVGEESVTVPAGTFKAIHYHNAKNKSDFWIVPDRPFVMVKTTGKNFDMSLVSSGKGAKSSITETPKEMGK